MLEDIFMQRIIHCLTLCCLSNLSFADNSLYCPQNHGYISLGMTEQQVIGACGQPTSKQDSNKPVMQKIPLKQLIYNDQGGATVFYGQFALPIGTGANYGSPGLRQKLNTGVSLQVDVVNNKVYSINVNGSASNAFSICNNQNIQVGDPASKVYGACGSPSLVNTTFLNQPIPSKTKPQIWIFQTGPYDPTISLTFVDGKLQSIN